jgi:DNA-directed RNA polymerase subunit M/transcription elongation factor TFIIS
MTVEPVQLNIECGNCGWMLWVEPDKNGDAIVWDGESVHCDSCGSDNQMSVDDSEVDPDGPAVGHAYVHSWVCKHGKDDETPCGECEPTPIGKCPKCGRPFYSTEGYCGGCQQY